MHHSRICSKTDGTLSFNGGKDWTYLSQAAEKPTAPNGLWEPFMRIGRRGEIQMTFSQELSHIDQDTMFLTSDDRGKTWSQPRPVTGVGEQLRDGSKCSRLCNIS